MIDLTNLDELSYSCLMRELNKKCSKSQVMKFVQIYKLYFDESYEKNLTNPEKIALQNSILEFSKDHQLKLSKKLIKSAAISELENAIEVGKYLSNIVRFILNKVPEEKRLNYLNKIKMKINGFDENDLSNKDMPESATIGQALTFIKHVLFNQEPDYIKEVLNQLVSNL